MKVYLAGKVAGRKWQVIAGCPSAEWVASDGGNHSEHLWGDGSPPIEAIGSSDLAMVIQNQVVDKLRSSYCLVAYLDTPDSYGSIVEITMMAAMGKPCLVVIRMPPTMFREEPDSFEWEQAVVMADAYWFVSCIPGIRAVTVASEQEATDVIRGFILLIRALLEQSFP